MSYLSDIAVFMEEQELGALSGYDKDIFVYAMPDTVTSGMLLKDFALGTNYDHELPKYMKTEFVVVVRSKDFAEGEEKAKAVSDTLTVANQTVGTLNVNYIRPRHVPMVFPVSEGDLIEFLLTFDACFVMSS